MSQTSCSVEQLVIVTFNRLVPKHSKQRLTVSESSFEDENDTSKPYSFVRSDISTNFYGSAPDVYI